MHDVKIALAALGMFSVLATSSAAAAQPRIDFGRHFQVRLHNQSDSSRDPAVGQTRVYVAATFVEASGDVRVTLSQRGRELVSFRCQPRRGYQVTCSSDWIDASTVDVAQPAEVAITHVDAASDAETALFAGSFPVLRFWDWVGDRSGRPVHVEQRALALDSAMGLAMARQISYGPVVDANTRTATSEIQFAYWDARGASSAAASSLRCRVGEGEWRAFRLSGPAPEGDAEELRNRVRGRDGSVSDETLTYQQYRFTASMPFVVQGAEPALSSPDASANGAWTCQLRDGDRRVVRELRFEVQDDALVPHAAQAQLAIEPGTAVVALAFGDALPARLDVDEVRGGFFGMRWASAGDAPIVAIPERTITWSPDAPAGAGGGRRRR